MNLYLVRHAVAFERDAERWPDDSERPLTPEGEEEFSLAALRLGQVVPQVEVLLSSPFARAWRTAEILAGQTAWSDPAGFPALEPDIPSNKAVLALETYAGARSIAMVGHRPGLHELASYLLTGEDEKLDIKIKKGGALCISFEDEPAPGAGRLRWLFTPKALRSLR